MRYVRFFSMLPLLAILVNCSVSKKMPEDPSAPVTDNTVVVDSYSLKLNGEWELTYLSGSKIAFAGLYPDKKPLLIFILPKMEVNGHTSCNPFSTNIQVNGQRIVFADPRSTMMACEGGGETAFLAALKKVSAFSVDDNTLTLLNDDVAMMRFVKK